MKHPSKDWYWIHNNQEAVAYPERFRGGEYGGFVLSAIQTFRLVNAYMTNLVKCGLNNAEGKFKGLGSFSDQCIQNCYRKFMSQEIELIKPRIIFVFGASVEFWIKHFVKDTYFIQQLPHPAGRRRGFRDEHYKVLYFWLILRALHKTGIVEMEESKELAKLFLSRYETYEA